MAENDPVPSDADFSKTLAMVLLGEYLAVAIVRLFSLYLVDGPPLLASTMSMASMLLFLSVLAMNLASMAGAWTMRGDPDLRSLTRISITMTFSQLCLLIPSFFLGNIAFHAVSAAATVVMTALLVLVAPGKIMFPAPGE